MLAARSPRDAEEMSSVLHVLSAIERMGNAAVDIARIVTHRLGIPAALVADLAAAEEVSHRVRVRPDVARSRTARSPTSSCPIEVGMRVVAIRRGKEWMIDPDGDDMLLPDDVLILRGPPDGIAELRELAGAPEWRPPGTDDDPAIPTDLDRAVDVLVEMKNVSEVAIGLAYSALLFNDQSLAAEVSHLEDRLDEMRERLEVWVLRSAAEQVEPSPLRGLLHLGARGRGARRRRAADGVAGRGGRGDAPGPRHRARRHRRGDRARAGVAGLVPRRPHARRGASSSSRPATTCSPSAAPGATSTGRAGPVRAPGRRRADRDRSRRGARAARRARRLPRARGRRHRRDRARAASTS